MNGRGGDVFRVNRERRVTCYLRSCCKRHPSLTLRWDFYVSFRFYLILIRLFRAPALDWVLLPLFNPPLVLYLMHTANERHLLSSFLCPCSFFAMPLLAFTRYTPSVHFFPHPVWLHRFLYHFAVTSHPLPHLSVYLYFRFILFQRFANVSEQRSQVKSLLNSFLVLVLVLIYSFLVPIKEYLPISPRIRLSIQSAQVILCSTKRNGYSILFYSLSRFPTLLSVQANPLANVFTVLELLLASLDFRTRYINVQGVINNPDRIIGQKLVPIFLSSSVRTSICCLSSTDSRTYPCTFSPSLFEVVLPIWCRENSMLWRFTVTNINSDS